jgi:integrase
MVSGDTHELRLAQVPRLSHILLYIYSVKSGRKVPAPAPARAAAELIAGYRPPSLPAAAARFARLAAAACEPADPVRAKALLFACGKLGAFACSAGLELDPGVCLHPSVIERFIVTAGRELTGPTRRTLRTNLRYAARRAGPQLGPPPVPLPRERAKAPYGDAEIAAYLALADAQPTQARRMRAAGLICLGAGAGLTGTDLRQVRGSDIICRSGGVIAEVRGRRPRAVPVLSRYHDLLLASAAFAGTHLVTGGRDPGRRNVTTPLISSLSGGTDLPRLDSGRLRAAWLRDCAEHLGLATFMAAAGITCSQRLGDLITTLDITGEAQAVALLGGTR